jgi:hypothetical protein
LLTLISSWTDTQVPQARIVVAHASVETRSTATGSEHDAAVDARVANGTVALVAARGQVGAVSFHTRIALACRYFVVTVDTAITNWAQTNVVERVRYDLARTARGAQVIRTRIDIVFTKCASIGRRALTNERIFCE